MMMRKNLNQTKNRDRLMKQTHSSEGKTPLKRERHSLLKAIFLKLKREDVV